MFSLPAGLLRRRRVFGITVELRHIRWFWQRLTRGFDDRDLWSLDYTIMAFTLPRLKRFRQVTDGYPGDLPDFEAWEAELDLMIAAFEYLLSDQVILLPDEDHQRGLDLFHSRFGYLWT